MNNVNTPAAVGVSTPDLTKPVQPQSKPTGAGFGWVITKADQGELLSHQGLQQAGSHLQGDRTNDRRVVTINADGIANIYNRKADGSFAKEASIAAKGLVNSATLSDDKLHVVTVSDDHRVGVHALGADGAWVTKTAISHDGPITLATFSADEMHVVTASDDHTAKVCDKMVDGSWVEKTTVQHDGPVNFVDFIDDGFRLVTSSENGTRQVTELK
ncbi:WD40 repeat domain-containing protein [Endozoicomonas sp. 8E]|uniref:WD40 repeat domain-containing protein n=1 Tax=Endozoicomonas sp. 8E TaxID=3035692 RepID=UPI0029394B03|nr:WD40 repeat domain-containing protein [Endozoicomonas sp. 8E]WOG29054.1 WD40 repeat domain-containing protein [Endozoicomonas sp. 8E]